MKTKCFCLCITKCCNCGLWLVFLCNNSFAVKKRVNSNTCNDLYLYIKLQLIWIFFHIKIKWFYLAIYFNFSGVQVGDVQGISMSIVINVQINIATVIVILTRLVVTFVTYPEFASNQVILDAYVVFRVMEIHLMSKIVAKTRWKTLIASVQEILLVVLLFKLSYDSLYVVINLLWKNKQNLQPLCFCFFSCKQTHGKLHVNRTNNSKKIKITLYQIITFIINLFIFTFFLIWIISNVLI